ncbi:MAG: 2-amino-4-hydroxy-6-hydroxymethyldihydropteridine diphosphokinase [Pseudanabaenaceae cyanobacterium]
MIPCAIALGSNLGDRAANLNAALTLLATHPHIVLKAVSAWYQTRAIAPDGQAAPQPDYWNGCALLATDLPPLGLLQVLLGIERKLGRERHAPWAPRTLDLDLLLYGDRHIQEPELMVPHPRLHHRAFVLQPLCDLAPDWKHPVLQKTIWELAQAPTDADVTQPLRIGTAGNPAYPTPRPPIIQNSA